MIGSNTKDEEADTFTMINNEEYAVTGSGKHQFHIAVTPTQWENADFGIHVNLSEADHESSWSPLETDLFYLDRNGKITYREYELE